MSESGILELGQMAGRRLRIAQQAYRSANGLVSSGVSDADRVTAVVQLDFAVETVLRAFLYAAGHPRPRAESFKEVLNGVRDTLSSRQLASDVPGRGGLEQLRSVRNAAQHEARVPTLVEATECLVHARDSLVDLVRIVWDADFFAADIDAIRSERVAKYLRQAVDAHADGDMPGGMGWLRAAFEYAFRYGGENLVGRSVDVRAIVVDDRHGRDNPDPFGRGEDAAVALRRLQVLGRLTSFGMNIGEYMRWRHTFSSAPPVNVNGELIRNGYEDSEWTDGDFISGLTYVVDSVLKMEQVVPDVDPGGFRKGGLDKL